MKKKLLLIIIPIIILLGLWIINLFPSYSAYVKGDFSFDEIAFIKDDMIQFINPNGENYHTLQIVYPVPIYYFGQQIPFIKKYEMKSLREVVWDATNETLGFKYGDPYHPQITYPGIIHEDGSILICMGDSSSSMNGGNPIHVIDRQKILINSYKNNGSKIMVFNMTTCKEESAFYIGTNIRRFAVSNKSWLAINETIDGELMLNVYDERRNLVFSDNQVDYYYVLAWSNEGNRLPNISKEMNDDKLYMYDFVTGEMQQISTNVSKASFSPDGEEILLMKPDGIYILDINSMEERFFVNGSYPDWRP